MYVFDFSYVLAVTHPEIFAEEMTVIERSKRGNTRDLHYTELAPMKDFVAAIVEKWRRCASICPSLTSYLAFSVPRPPVLRILALALAFFLPSIGKFAQQRLRGGCKGKEMKVTTMSGGIHPMTQQKERSPCELCLFLL